MTNSGGKSACAGCLRTVYAYSRVSTPAEIAQWLVAVPAGLAEWEGFPDASCLLRRKFNA